MAGSQIQMTAQQRRNSLSELVDAICAQTQAEQVSRTEYHLGDADALLLVMEQYFVRAGGYISLTVLLTEQAGKQTAEIISSGGGKGSDYSFGACRSFAKSCVKALEGCGFTDNDPEPEKPFPKRIVDFFVD